MKKFTIKTSLLIVYLFAFLFVSCGKVITKYDAFPQMYEEKPVSVLVLPPINESTAADAKDYYITTVAEPVSLCGYYVFPIEVITEVLHAEGLYDTEILDESAIPKFKEYFGADAVLFIRILDWDTSYYVVGGNVKVKVSYKLVSTTTSETLWKYEGEKKVDTTGDSGGAGGLAGLLVQAVTTAVKTATTDYVPLAKKANSIALVSIPYGKYHPQFNQDQKAKVVKEKLVKTEEEENK
jgi:hypothetical protein